MFVDNGRVQVVKAIPKSEPELRDFYRQFENRALAFHVRNQSIGPVNLENAHPFWVTNRDWDHPNDIAMMHNGTVRDVQVNSDLSDTGNLAVYVYRPLFAKRPELYDDPEFWFNQSMLIGNNKLVFLRDDGTFVIVNPGLGRIMHGSGVWVSSKDPLRPVAEDGVSRVGDGVKEVAATKVDTNVQLSPKGMTWEKEPDGINHLRVGEAAFADATSIAEVREIAARMA